MPNANGPIDWKCDGNPTETNVQADVNAQLAYPLVRKPHSRLSETGQL